MRFPFLGRFSFRISLPLRKDSAPFRPDLTKLEDRTVPAGVLMTNGGLTGVATWGTQPTPPIAENLASYFTAVDIVTKDINGQPIDFNQDGYPDLVQTGAVEEAIGYGTKANPLVSFSRGGFGKVAFGGPTGLTYATTGTTSRGVTSQFIGDSMGIADLNGDGFQDVLVLENTSDSGAGAQSARYLWDSATQSFTKVAGGPLDAWADRYGQLTLGDVNGDNLPDLISQNYSTTPVVDPVLHDVLPMTGFQVFLGKSDPATGKWVGDFETTAFATINLKQPSSSWGIPFDTTNQLKTDTVNATPVISTVLADLNGDGKLDLAIPEADGISVFPNPGDSKFTQGSALFFQTAGKAPGLNLVTGDFNNDGKPDLATSPNVVSLQLMGDLSPTLQQWQASTAPLSVFLNTTPAGGAIDFSLTPLNGFATGGPAYNGTIALADFTGDGNLDIAVANGSNLSTHFGILEGDGKGGFASVKQFTGYSNATDGYDDTFQRALVYLNSGDFNNDGQIDIASSALNIGPDGTPGTGKSNPAVGITALSFNQTFPTPTINAAAIAPGTVGVPYSQQLQVIGGDPSKPFAFALNSQSIPLPTGLTLSSTGLISGTPTQAGPFQLFLDVSQVDGPKGTSPANLQVNNNQPGVVTISPATLPDGVVNVTYNQTLTQTGGTGAIAWAVSSGTLPQGLSLSPTGLISGQPAATGVSSFTISATDSLGNIGYRQYSLTVTSNPTPILAGPNVVAGAGGDLGTVTVFNPDGTPRSTFRPYGSLYLGGVNVAQGDIDGDGTNDLITGTTAGAVSHVKAFNGKTLTVMQSFYAYNLTFLGGVNVAAGDVNGDGKADIITGAGPGGGPHVEVFDGTTGQSFVSFFAYAADFLGGVNVSAGDVNGDGKADIITGAGAGGGSHVKAFSADSQTPLLSFFAYNPGFLGGVYVATGDLNGDGNVDIVTGPGAGGGSNVKGFSGTNGDELASFFAFGAGNTLGVKVSAADLNGDGNADYIAANATNGFQVSEFDSVTLALLKSFAAFNEPVGVSVSGQSA